MSYTIKTATKYLYYNFIMIFYMTLNSFINIYDDIILSFYIKSTETFINIDSDMYKNLKRNRLINFIDFLDYNNVKTLSIDNENNLYIDDDDASGDDVSNGDDASDGDDVSDVSDVSGDIDIIEEGNEEYNEEYNEEGNEEYNEEYNNEDNEEEKAIYRFDENLLDSVINSDIEDLYNKNKKQKFN